MCRLTQVNRTDGIVERTEKCHKFTHCHSICIDYSPYTMAHARTHYIQLNYVGAFNRHLSVGLFFFIFTASRNMNENRSKVEFGYNSLENSREKFVTHTRREKRKETKMNHQRNLP